MSEQDMPNLDAILDGALADLEAQPLIPLESEEQTKVSTVEETKTPEPAAEGPPSSAKEPSAKEKTLGDFLAGMMQQGAVKPEPPAPEVALPDFLGEFVPPAAPEAKTEGAEAGIEEALRMLQQQQQQPPQPNEQELARMLAEMGMAEGTETGAAPAGMEQDQLRNMMETMMQMPVSPEDQEELGAMMQGMFSQMVSKKTLGPYVDEVVKKFPIWINENKHKLSAEEITRYEAQLGHFQTLQAHFASKDGEDGAKTMQLMQKFASHGDPPQEFLATVQSSMPQPELPAFLDPAAVEMGARAAQQAMQSGEAIVPPPEMLPPGVTPEQFQQDMQQMGEECKQM